MYVSHEQKWRWLGLAVLSHAAVTPSTVCKSESSESFHSRHPKVQKPLCFWITYIKPQFVTLIWYGKQWTWSRYWFYGMCHFSLLHPPPWPTGCKWPDSSPSRDNHPLILHSVSLYLIATLLQMLQLLYSLQKVCHISNQIPSNEPTL